MKTVIFLALAIVAVIGPLAATAEAQVPSCDDDPSPHGVHRVIVASGVGLEVLDWGGGGEAMLLLAGLGNSAHAYDDFAPRFRDRYRVYGLTRRGFGASDHPEGGYDSATRARDILTVLDSLGVDRAVLVGHSIAGDELSRFAVDYPERVRALVYLDAYSYGTDADSIKALEDPPMATPPMSAADSATVASVTEYISDVYGIRIAASEVCATSTFGPAGRLDVLFASTKSGAVMEGTNRSEFARIQAPALALFATGRSLHDMFPDFDRFDAENRRMAEALASTLQAWKRQQVQRFRDEMRRGTVVEVPGGHHYVHFSHPELVERTIRDFLRGTR